MFARPTTDASQIQDLTEGNLRIPESTGITFMKSAGSTPSYLPHSDIQR
jgi:hypothetical protein